MTSFLRKVMTGLALLVVGGLVIGGTMALASNRSTGAAVSSSASQTARVDDDGTADQGPGDVPFDDDEVGDDHGGHGGNDHSGPSENSGPGSDDSGHGSDDSGHGSDD